MYDHVAPTIFCAGCGRANPLLRTSDGLPVCVECAPRVGSVRDTAGPPPGHRTPGSAPTVFVECTRCRGDGRTVGMWCPAASAEHVTVDDVHRGSGVDWRRQRCGTLRCTGAAGLPFTGELSTAEAGCWGRLAAEAGELWAAMCAWMTADGRTPAADEAVRVDIDGFRDRYCGSWDSFDDFAYRMARRYNLFDGASDWARWRDAFRTDYLVIPADSGGYHVISRD